MASICVVGTGHGGSAAASVLAAKGHDVSMLKISAIESKHFKSLSGSKTIEFDGIMGSGSCVLREVTDDPSLVIPTAEVVLVFYVTNYHPQVAQRIAPYIRDDQLIYVCPGYLGSVVISREMARVGNRSIPVFAEGETLPFTSRIVDPGRVTISSLNVRHPIAVVPIQSREMAVTKLEYLLGETAVRQSLLEVALQNPNLVIHTVGTILNVSRVEDPKRTFAMYRDGFTPSIWKIVDALDREKMMTLEALGCKSQTYFDAFLLRTFENYESVDPYEGFKMYAAESPDGPHSVETRYLTEDVPMGLCLLEDVGKEVGVPTPAASLLIDLASMLLERDLRSCARTLRILGFSGISELKRFEETGVYCE